MSGDEADDPKGCAAVARELGPAACMVEVTGERRVPSGQLRAHSRRKAEQHSGDTVPQERVHGFRRVVEDAGDDELLIRTEVPQDARGLGPMAIVCTGRADVSYGLLHAVEHQKFGPTKSRARQSACCKTIVLRIRAPKKKSARSSIGPYCWNVRQLYFCCGASNPYTTFEPSSGGIGIRVKMARMQF